MRDGFVKIAAATPAIKVADCHTNAEEIFHLMREADRQGVKVLCFPELCLTGSTCGDLFWQQTLLRGAEEALNTILDATRSLDLIAAIGLPAAWQGGLYNCAALIQKGNILGLVPKENLTAAEGRWFTPGSRQRAEVVSLCGQDVPMGGGMTFACETLSELVLGVELGGDLWAVNSPAAELCAKGATVILNPAALPEQVGRDHWRRSQVCAQSGKLVCGYVRAEAGEGESTTDLVFGGHHLIAENGNLLAQRRFQTGLTISEVDVQLLVSERRRLAPFGGGMGGPEIPFSLPLSRTTLSRPIPMNPFVPESVEEQKARWEEMLLLASLGLKKRLEHAHTSKAVIGLSGGLDSTLAILVTKIAMDLLGRPGSDIIAITMPCFGTTDRTRDNACLLADCLGADLRRIDIGLAVRQHFADIGQSMNDHSVTFENGQARERTQVLMDVANMNNGLVVGTGDLSELALGWATYNGDHMSMYSVNGSIPKTLVRHLVRFVADDKVQSQPELARVLYDILDTPVSPELLPAVQGEIAQKTEDLVGPYELHDFFLYYIVRYGFSPAKVFRMAQHALGHIYSREVILKWLKIFCRRFFIQQFKRSCLPDGPKVGAVSLSPRGDWVMPSDAVSALWMEELTFS